MSVLGGIWFWAYWPTLAEIVERWSTNPLYSHGYLVPGFAAFLLWHRRRMLGDESGQPSCWGVLCIAFGAALHLAGAYFYFDWASAASSLPVLVGLGLAWGGVKVLRWNWPAIAFLVFMLPLPYRVEVSLAFPLQRLATLASTYLLQTLGFPAIAEGNVIIMEEARLGVIEACNGLGMLVTFFALTSAVALLLKRGLLGKGIIVLSAIPIALLANVVRITVTGVLAEIVGSEVAVEFFHRLGGWLMMPLALGMLWLELKVLATLVIQAPSEDLPLREFTEMFAPRASCPVRT